MEPDRTLQLNLGVLQHLTLQQTLIISLLEMEDEEKAEDETQDKKRKKRKPRSSWVEEWLLERSEMGAWTTLIPTLARSSTASYRKLFRMDERMFNEILQRLRSRIEKKDTF